MSEFRFTIPGRPVTWQRTNDVRGRRVTDAAQRAEKRRIAAIARAARPRGWPMDLEYAVAVEGYWPDRRFGDSDRLVSLTMDALEGVAYPKDREVSAQGGVRHVDKLRPRVEVHIVAFDPRRERAAIEITIGKQEG